MPKAAGYWLLLAAALLPMRLAAAELQPVVLYAGQIEDGSFNAAIHRGVERFTRLSGIVVEERSVSYQANRLPVTLVDVINEGFDPIVMLPSTRENLFALEKVAEAYATNQFVILDAKLKRPNVYAIQFKEHEASFLAGVLAAMKTRTGVVGFVGGADIPVIRHRFAGGFLQGLQHVRPDIRFLESYVGNTPSAWFKPKRGRALARAQLEQGADIIFQAAGESGLGVLAAVSEAGKLGIGVDLNQNGLHPGKVLTSVLKRVDQAVFLALIDQWRCSPGGRTIELGLADEGVSLAMDAHNDSLISPEDWQQLESLAGQIRSGELRVKAVRQGQEAP